MFDKIKIIVLFLLILIVSGKLKKKKKIEKNQDHLLDDFIVNGEKAELSEVPYFAAIYDPNESYEYTKCGASILTARKIVSAAHCFEDNVNSYMVRYATTDFFHSKYDDVKIIEVIKHPNYIYENKSHDIAVAILEKDLSNWDDKIARIATVEPKIGEEVKIFGFGMMEDGSYSRYLLKTTLKVEYLYESFVIARKENTGSCFSDSGGPMVASDGRLLAILVSGSGDEKQRCLIGGYSFFASVPKHVDFIREAMKGRG